MGYEVDESVVEFSMAFDPKSKEIFGTLFIDGLHWDDVRKSRVGTYWGPIEGIEVPQRVDLLIISAEKKIGFVSFEVRGILTSEVSVQS